MPEVTCYYRLAQALEHPTDDPDSMYYIAEEKQKKDGSVGRCYYTFPTASLFRKHRDMFPHCHELLVRHRDSTLDHNGRLVFDFDLPLQLPRDLRGDIQSVIATTLERDYPDFSGEYQYIWSETPNPKKTSWHLTVKGVFFRDWVKESKIFYQLFQSHWDKRYGLSDLQKEKRRKLGKVIWPSSDELVDQQVIRKNASLRMVGSSKIGGETSHLSDPDHTLEDSLIRPWKKAEPYMSEPEQLHELIDSLPGDQGLRRMTDPQKKRTLYPPRTVQKIEKILHLRALEQTQTLWQDQFQPDTVVGDHIQLRRIAPGSCPLSGKHHDSDNAYLRVTRTGSLVHVSFCCWRRCRQMSTRGSCTFQLNEGEKQRAERENALES